VTKEKKSPRRPGQSEVAIEWLMANPPDLVAAKENCTEIVLKKVSNGVCASEMTPRWAKEYFRANSNRSLPRVRKKTRDSNRTGRRRRCR
jgi:hypothetical protein